MPVLVDTNVLLDVATEDPRWFDWSVSRLAQAANRDGAKGRKDSDSRPVST